MSEPERRRGRVYDAESAREAILNAAEEAFAREGFDGARIDAIAEAAGYNKSLIFHYYEDKLGLYTAVIRRLSQIGAAFQINALRPFFEKDEILQDATKFRQFVETLVGQSFDFLQAHPHLLRIFAWEAAEGWKTLRLVASRGGIKSTEELRSFLDRAMGIGFIRPDIDPVMLVVLVQSVSQTYLTSIPRFQLVFPERDLSSPEALAHAREQIVRFVVYATLTNPKEAEP